jgi:hypothetical protein
MLSASPVKLVTVPMGFVLGGMLSIPLQYYGVHKTYTLQDSIDSIAFCAAIGAGVALVLY